MESMDLGGGHGEVMGGMGTHKDESWLCLDEDKDGEQSQKSAYYVLYFFLNLRVLSSFSVSTI